MSPAVTIKLVLLLLSFAAGVIVAVVWSVAAGVGFLGAATGIGLRILFDNSRRNAPRV